MSSDSSPVSAAGGWRRVLADRTFQVLALGALLVGVIGSIRYEDDSGVHPDAYWARKKSWSGVADMVITGDSRSYIGLSPALMNEQLPGLRIRNYGFNATGYSEEYLKAIDKVLDPASKDRRLLLCVSPFSVTDRGASEFARNEFVVTKAMDHWEEFLYTRGNRELYFFEPMAPKDIWYGIWPHLKKQHFYKEWFADGWCAFSTIPERPRSQLGEYLKMFKIWPVRELYVNRLLDYVRGCRASGIRVYGIRLPTSGEMHELENRFSGFDEDAFARRFEEAGGHWLRVDPAAYSTFDDSHLNRQGAEKLSREVARQIRELDEAHKSSPGS